MAALVSLSLDIHNKNSSACCEVKYSMQKFPLECFYTVKKFSNHSKVKDQLLLEIENSDYESPTFDAAEVDISKCDWHLSKDFTRKWFLYIKDMLLEDMLNIYSNIGYDGFTLQEIWFQQYFNNSQHGWHTHSSNFTNVYYVDLPNDSSKTQIISPYDQKTIIELDVKEGDIITFPSFVIHRGPKNNSADKKTIISFNTDLTYSDKIYASHLGEKNNAFF